MRRSPGADRPAGSIGRARIARTEATWLQRNGKGRRMRCRAGPEPAAAGVHFRRRPVDPPYSESFRRRECQEPLFTAHLAEHAGRQRRMDTVTETGWRSPWRSKAASAVIHRNQAPERQAEQVAAVKAAALPADACSPTWIPVAAARGSGRWRRRGLRARAERWTCRSDASSWTRRTPHSQFIEALLRYRASYGDSIDLVAGMWPLLRDAALIERARMA